MSRLVPHRGRRLSLLSLLLIACDAPVSPTLVFESDLAFPERETIPTPVGDLALITNNYDDTLSYIDLGLTPPAEIARLPVGLNPVEREGPHHVTVSPDGLAWVGISNFVPNSGSGPHGAHGTGQSPGHALLIRVSDGVELASVRVDRNPGDIRLTPDGRRVLVSHFDLLRITDNTGGDFDSRLAIIDVKTRTREALVPVCPAAHGVAISPDSKTAYIACWDDRVAKVDLGSPDHPVETTPVLPIPGTLAEPECQPYALTLSRDGKTLWVGCLASGELRGFDTTTMTPIAGYDLGGAALFGTELDDGRFAIPVQVPDALAFFDPSEPLSPPTLVPLDPSACVLPHVVAVRKDKLLLVCEGDRVAPGSFVILDYEGKVERVIPVGLYPDDLAIVPKARAAGAP